MQSFLGSLNYYSKFIEDYANIASILYGLTDEQLRAGHDLDKAKLAFALLRDKLLGAPLLRHPDREKPFVVILHASNWAVSAVLAQEHAGLMHPVRFTGRTLQDAELRYHVAEKEVLALPRVLTSFYTIVAGKPIRVYTRFSVLKWLMNSKSVSGRCLQWATLLSPWTLDIHRISKDEDSLAKLFADSITPRELLDQIACEVEPDKRSKARTPAISVEMLTAEYTGHAITFDGAAKLKTRRGSASYIIWRLPGWFPLEASGFTLENVTVNEAEYEGMLRGLARARELGIRDVVVVGDSRIAVQQCQGTIGCNEARLQVLLNRFTGLRTSFDSLELAHVKREFNSPADFLASKALQGDNVHVRDVEGLQQLRDLNKLQRSAVQQNDSARAEINAEPETNQQESAPSCDVLDDSAEADGSDDSSAHRSESRQHGAHDAAHFADAQDEAEVFVATRSQSRRQTRSERRRRWKQHQENDAAHAALMRFLRGELDQLTQHQARDAAKLADAYAIGEDGLLRPTGEPR
ncbi:hypothetical protein P43SY_010465 [Pythium insidiosum]|uniref:Reverse transcriptase n=1 Tax=Pythium insidiosum TaxID=114742 RepID=A0AAD5LS66_PYTIN|nr:hypothetical protein P43SY_010465 [Pythium insidiosum]